MSIISGRHKEEVGQGKIEVGKKREKVGQGIKKKERKERDMKCLNGTK